MAEKKSAVSYDSVMRDLRAGKFAPIYILMGDEPYYIDQICDFISEHALREEERDFNQNVVFGADVNDAQIVLMAREVPMMADYRVIIVKEAQGLRSTKVLEKYLEKPVKSSILVLCHKNGSIDKRKAILTKAAQVGVVFESKKLTDYELSRFVEQYLKAHQTLVDQKSIGMIVDHVGPDLNRMVGELDKVLLGLPADNRSVTPEIVERQIGVSKDFNRFELLRAIVNKDVYKANLIINYFNNNPRSVSAFLYLPMIFNYFKNLMLAYYAPNRNNENSVAEYLGLRSSWAARDYVTGMRNYTGRKTLQIISKIREVDGKIKGIDNPNTDLDDLMKELIFFILH